MSDVYPAGDLSEREMLPAFLDMCRQTLINKVTGIDDEKLRRHLVPSDTTLLGLVKHITDVERWWFQICFAGDGEMDFDENDPDADWRIEDGETTEEIVSRYKAACDRSREIVASAASFDEPCQRKNHTHRSLRWVLVHMIEESARHAGHADILREQLDGATGVL